jgi:hypothetical protein
LCVQSSAIGSNSKTRGNALPNIKRNLFLGGELRDTAVLLVPIVADVITKVQLYQQPSGLVSHHWQSSLLALIDIWRRQTIYEL